MNAVRSIAFLCHPYHRGGVTSWMLNAAIDFACMGHEVFFVTVDPVKPFYSGKDREKMADLLANRTKDVRLVSAAVDYAFEFGTEDIRAAVYIDLIKKQVPAGVPLIISDDTSVWKAAAAVADKYPMVGVLHGDHDHYYEKAVKYQEQLSVCACVSDRIRNTAIKRCHKTGPDRFFSIPCGIELPVFNPLKEQGSVSRLIFIGRLTDYEKRATDLVKICALLQKEGVLFHLDIVGNSEASANEFAGSFKEQGIGEHVSFHGWRSKEEIQKLLNASDVLLLTSNSEGMPLVMMEALASGCGFTGTRVSGIEDYEFAPLAADCVSVYTIGDIADAVNKIQRILAIPAETRQLSARKLAEAAFSMEICLKKYKDAIDSVKTLPRHIQDIKPSTLQRLYSKTIAMARYLKVRLKP